MQNSVIHIHSVSKKYKGADTFAVHQLSLEIEKGEIYGLLGPNGAGKTTLISMICGLLKPTSGQITINGLSFKENAKKIKQAIGVVPQEYALYPTLTAYENLMYFGAMYGLSGNNLKSKVIESLGYLGLEKFQHKKIRTFSGGMKRRVNLIAGILHQPEILFLDEPTVGVDVQSKNVIMEHLKTLNSNGTTIVYTSHHLNEAESFCTQVSIIDRGTIVTSGTPKELIKNTTEAQNLEDVFIQLTGEALRDYA
ncbi:ABC transporter ATP-binding protein [Aureibaculum sp. 2210JD6-5]|uniref:ABC transporter ATP-binding protein n=1 Tax=Aureibaculum sp. 2210JD6-5 TaxID=3103957 RepID=UPI002AAD5144|nr:ABC transporter ATP-binding protein [Aureibaculum sp. 2210JD6-5]MDY7393889.1 ABC transporter ATP-binding protein [Aureibaculum sp. 2210JD6-5]